MEIQGGLIDIYQFNSNLFIYFNGESTRREPTNNQRLLHSPRIEQTFKSNHTPTSILPKEVQYAFKDSMTHRLLQFALHIAVRCFLHRFKSQDIHREEL